MCALSVKSERGLHANAEAGTEKFRTRLIRRSGAQELHIQFRRQGECGGSEFRLERQEKRAERKRASPWKITVSRDVSTYTVSELLSTGNRVFPCNSMRLTGGSTYVSVQRKADTRLILLISDTSRSHGEICAFQRRQSSVERT